MVLETREAGWRLQAILRPRRFFLLIELVRLYKSLVLSYIESGTAAYYHAAHSVLRPVDRVQERLLRECGLTDIEALERFKLAPLPSRRDMAMLGLLHRVVLGQAPPQLRELFPFAVLTPARSNYQTRLLSTVRRHNKQLLERPGHTDVFSRSLFGLVSSYNLLPQHIVDTGDISKFQHVLQQGLLRAAKEGLDDWQHVLAGHVIRRQVAFQRLFEE